MEYKSFMEALKGKQKKLDKNHNGELDKQDFEILRKEETEQLEEGTVKSQKYSWGTMKTVHHNFDFSIPLHPEHHEAIAKLKDQQEHKFKTEDGKHWTAKRSGDDVHFQGANGSSTKVKHSTMSESVEELDEIRRMKTKLNKLDPVSHMSVARQKLSNLMKSSKTKGALIANKRRTLNMGDDIDQEDLDALNEVLSKDAKAGDWIHDFVHSQNPKFDGKSKKERIKMALGAYYDTNKKKDGVSEGYQSYSGPSHGHAYGGSGFGRREREDDEYHVPDPVPARRPQAPTHAPVAPVPDRKYIKGTPENKAHKAANKPINGHPTNEEVEEIEERNKENALMRKTMDASRGARYKLNNPVPAAEPEHKTAQAHNKAIGRALRNEDKMTTQKDKNGKLISFKYEGDWKKSTEKKEGSGKAANLAGQAMQKMQQANEEVEQIEENVYDGADQANSIKKALVAKHKDNNYNVRVNQKGQHVIDHAYFGTKKVKSQIKALSEANEQAEYIEELSKSTLGSYAKKASRDAVITRKIGADFERKADAARSPGMKAASNELSSRYKQKSFKRRDGLEKAVDRLTKEEIKEAINDNLHPAGAALLKHIKPEHHNKYKEHLTTDVFTGSYKDRSDVLNAAKNAGHLKEAKDEQEYGYEGDMALNQLATLTRCADMIKEILKPDTDLPEWVQSKITLATDYIQTAADYMHSEMNEAKSVEVKVNAAGDAPHEEKWEPVKKVKKPVKESFDDEGNLIPHKISYKDFITEIKLADLPVRRIQGHSYGANYFDPEGADDYDDKKPMKPAAEKRGRGRPAGAKSGARKITGTSKLMNK